MESNPQLQNWWSRWPRWLGGSCCSRKERPLNYDPLTEGIVPRFTLFPKLPLELRLKIWAYTMEPRIVTIYSQRLYDEANGSRTSRAMWWNSPDPVPTILHICHKSREEALKYYQRLFKPSDRQAIIYFNFSKDTLRIGNIKHDSWIGGTSIGGDPITQDVFAFFNYTENHVNIAENLRFMITEIDDHSSIWNQLRRFPALRELTVIPWEPYGPYHSNRHDEWMELHRMRLRFIVQKNPQWLVPKITVMSVLSGAEWGTLTVQDEGNKSEVA
jgi:hypothetical protein